MLNLAISLEFAAREFREALPMTATAKVLGRGLVKEHTRAGH